MSHYYFDPGDNGHRFPQQQAPKNAQTCMKTMSYSLLIVLALFVGAREAVAQGARFFRISGPTATTITAFEPDGTLVWSNAQPGGTYVIQTAASLVGATNWVDYVQVSATNGVHTNLLVAFNPPAGMALVPAGAFTMGDSLDGEHDALPTITVNVSAFYMDVNLVSYSQWQPVYNWAVTAGYGFDNSGSGKADDQPVQNVDWYDVVMWCNARSQQEGRIPVYYTDGAFTQVYTNGEVDVVLINPAANGYRLPTEAEWEKAARGGLSGQRFPWGNIISENLANYNGDTAKYSYDLGPNGLNPIGSVGGITPATSPVGTFAANGFGLHDMAGNVWGSGVGIGHGAVYIGGTDPQGALTQASTACSGVEAGWITRSRAMLRYTRNSYYPSSNSDYIGFRCVMSLHQ